MDEYYDRVQLDGASPEPKPEGPPPSYKPQLQCPTPLRRFNIQPREDEGREALPEYSSAISLEGVFLRKLEVEGAIHRANDRNWYKVVVTLQGTALTIRKYKSSGWFSRGATGKPQSPDSPADSRRGLLLKSYNLQHAEVGIAADYLKKSFVIRVRAEGDQFLLSCRKIEPFVLWLQSLFAAIDLAPPLEDRDLPRDMSVPRPRRRRIPRPAEQEPQVNGEQQEHIASQFPRLTGEAVPEPSTSCTISGLEFNAAPPPTSQPLRRRSSMIPLIMGVCTSTAVNSNAPNPNISPSTGKWAPRPPRTPWTEVQYARRCMATLTSRSPHKSRFVIMMGNRWVIDWATGKMTKWVPPTDSLPEYGDDGLEKIIVEAEREEEAT